MIKLSATTAAPEFSVSTTTETKAEPKTDLPGQEEVAVEFGSVRREIDLLERRYIALQAKLRAERSDRARETRLANIGCKRLRNENADLRAQLEKLRAIAKEPLFPRWMFWAVAFGLFSAATVAIITPIWLIFIKELK